MADPKGGAASAASDRAEEKAERSKQLKSKIQASIDQKREEQKREMFRRRIDMARQGTQLYRVRKYAEAAQAYMQYLKILEDWKHVPERGLTPGLFDVKTDISELLLISGVYWDLAKLYDRTRSPRKLGDFRHYLQQYVAFSKGMPYQGVSMETLRKYLRKGKASHTSDFRRAYFQLSGSNCFIATSLVEYLSDQEIEEMRLLRDRQMMHSSIGRVFVQAYRIVAPGVAHLLDGAPDAWRLSAVRVLRAAHRVFLYLFS